MPVQQLRVAAWNRWLDSHTPYACVDTTEAEFPGMQTSGGTPVRVRMMPAPMVRALFKRHIEHEGWNNHQLHGSFGKAMDVLNVVAYGEAEVGAANTTEAVVRRSAISRAMVAAGVSSHFRSQVHGQIENNLFWQSRTGQAVGEQPETRVYGNVSSDSYDFGGTTKA